MDFQREEAAGISPGNDSYYTAQNRSIPWFDNCEGERSGIRYNEGSGVSNDGRSPETSRNDIILAKTLDEISQALRAGRSINLPGPGIPPAPSVQEFFNFFEKRLIEITRRVPQSRERTPPTRDPGALPPQERPPDRGDIQRRPESCPSDGHMNKLIANKFPNRNVNYQESAEKQGYRDENAPQQELPCVPCREPFTPPPREASFHPPPDRAPGRGDMQRRAFREQCPPNQTRPPAMTRLRSKFAPRRLNLEASKSEISEKRMAPREPPPLDWGALCNHSDDIIMTPSKVKEYEGLTVAEIWKRRADAKLASEAKLAAEAKRAEARGDGAGPSRQRSPCREPSPVREVKAVPISSYPQQQKYNEEQEFNEMDFSGAYRCNLEDILDPTPSELQDLSISSAPSPKKYPPSAKFEDSDGYPSDVLNQAYRCSDEEVLGEGRGRGTPRRFQDTPSPRRFPDFRFEPESPPWSGIQPQRGNYLKTIGEMIEEKKLRQLDNSYGSFVAGLLPAHHVSTPKVDRRRNLHKCVPAPIAVIRERDSCSRYQEKSSCCSTSKGQASGQVQRPLPRERPANRQTPVEIHLVTPPSHYYDIDEIDNIDNDDNICSVTPPSHYYDIDAVDNNIRTLSPPAHYYDIDAIDNNNSC